MSRLAMLLLLGIATCVGCGEAEKKEDPNASLKAGTPETDAMQREAQKGP